MSQVTVAEKTAGGEGAGYAEGKAVKGVTVCKAG